MVDTVKGEEPISGEHAESTRTTPVFTPAADIYETKDALILALEMPGVDPDAIDVTLDKRVLTITGRGRPAAPKGYALTHAEYREGDYERAFTLSQSIDSSDIQASARDGVLRLVLPKAKPEPAKTISVTAGG